MKHLKHSSALLWATLLCILPLAILMSYGRQPASGAPLYQGTATLPPPTGILAEAIGEANLRTGPGIEFDLVGKISSGTRYEVLGRDEFYPWVLLSYPTSQYRAGWVYQDLISTTATLTQIPVVSDPFLSLPAIQVTLPPTSPTATAPTTDLTATLAAPATATSTVAPAAVFLEANAEVNVRFGPGIDYPRIERIAPGQRYTVLSRHALYPWVLIDLPDAPEGSGWVYTDVVTITGNLNSIPLITAEQVGWPTLTPTPPFVVTSLPPWSTSQDEMTGNQNTQAVNLTSAGDSILTFLLDQGFIPEEDSFGSVFVLDLQTGQSISLGTNIAYSGMSLIKIPILVEFFRQANRPPDQLEAELIANTMICSGNHTANELLSRVGGGDPYAGTQQITNTMMDLGLENTFVLAPFKLGDQPVEERPITPLDTAADQIRSTPDPFNQTTPEDLGWLLGAVYQCAVTEDGPLIETYPGELTPTECRQIILTMSRNQINVLTEAGVPIGTTVAHKHGWIDDTHGDASIVFTPGGNFVITMALHGRDWLPYERSWPAMAEIARIVYNTYNPDDPLAAIHPSTVDETCDLVGNPLLGELQQSIVAPLSGTG